MRDWMTAFFFDLRFSLRQFRRSPLFTTVAILSLGAGIGANTAIFSLMNSMLLSNLPVRDPERLVILTSPSEEGRSTGMAETSASRSVIRNSFSCASNFPPSLDFALLVRPCRIGRSELETRDNKLCPANWSVKSTSRS